MTYKDRTNYVVNNNKLNYKLNEYDIVNYTSETFDIFKRVVGLNSKKTKLSFTDSSIILTMKKSNITDLVSFDQQFKNFNEINLIGLDYL